MADDGDVYVSAAAAAELVSFCDRIVRELKKQGALVLDVSTGELTRSRKPPPLAVRHP